MLRKKRPWGSFFRGLFGFKSFWFPRGIQSLLYLQCIQYDEGGHVFDYGDGSGDDAGVVAAFGDNGGVVAVDVDGLLLFGDGCGGFDGDF